MSFVYYVESECFGLKSFLLLCYLTADQSSLNCLAFTCCALLRAWRNTAQKSATISTPKLYFIVFKLQARAKMIQNITSCQTMIPYVFPKVSKHTHITKKPCATNVKARLVSNVHPLILCSQATLGYIWYRRNGSKGFFKLPFWCTYIYSEWYYVDGIQARLFLQI